MFVQDMTALAGRVAVRVLLAAPSPAPKDGPDTQGLADWLRAIFGPLFLVVVSLVALFFLFTREITRFVQFIVLVIAIAVIFYFPGIIEVVASGAANALGLKK